MEIANRRLNERHWGIDASDDQIKQAGDLAKQTGDLAKQLLEAQARKKQLEAETGCIKPLIMLGDKKKAYEACLQKAKATGYSPSPVATPPSPAPAPSFFNTPAGYVTIGVGVLVAIGGTILAIKYLKK